jgi:glycerol uptake facilitator-like aquaporin
VHNLARRLAAEALGTAFLVATVIGSGIMAQSLTQDTAVALLGNTLATGAMLVVLITILGPISGAHFNPAVTAVFAAQGAISLRLAGAYAAVQLIGGVAGTFTAHLMFGHPLIDPSTHARTGGAQWFSEFIASASTSPPATGSPPQHPSPTPPSPLRAPSPTAFPASARPTCPASSPPNSSALS